MGKILLSAGHSETAGRDRGASANGYTEGEETAKMRRAIYDQLKLFGADVFRDPDNTILSDTLKTFRTLTDANAICIDIHFNAAGNKTAKGTETFVENNPTPQELELAGILSDVIAATLKTPKRGKFKGVAGVKSESESQHKNGLGWMRMPGINILIEVEFITNPDAINTYAENFLLLCCNLANAIYQFSQRCNQPSQPVHIVKSGDTLSKLAVQYKTTTAKLKALNALSSTVIRVGDKLFV